MPTYAPILDSEIAAESPVTVSLMTRLRDNALSYLGAPTGTNIISFQPTAPLGWFNRSDTNDRVLKAVSSGAGSGGGVLAFSTVFAYTETGFTTITGSTMPPHAHGGAVGADTLDHTHTHGQTNVNNINVDKTAAANTPVNQGTNAGGVTAGRSNIHSHLINSEGSGNAHTHPNDMRVTYSTVSMIQKSA